MKDGSSISFGDLQCLILRFICSLPSKQFKIIPLPPFLCFRFSAVLLAGIRQKNRWNGKGFPLYEMLNLEIYGY